MRKSFLSLKTYLILSVILLICGLAVYLVLKKSPEIPERALFVNYSIIKPIFFIQGIFPGMFWWCS